MSSCAGRRKPSISLRRAGDGNSSAKTMRSSLPGSSTTRTSCRGSSSQTKKARGSELLPWMITARSCSTNTPSCWVRKPSWFRFHKCPMRWELSRPRGRSSRRRTRQELRFYWTARSPSRTCRSTFRISTPTGSCSRVIRFSRPLVSACSTARKRCSTKHRRGRAAAT